MITREFVGDIMFRGPASHFLNVDFASRTGFYGLAFRDDPYRRAQIGDVAYFVESLGGPAYSMLRIPDRAIDYWEKGETEKAIESTLPSFIRNPMKAFRYGTEGALNSKGYPIVEDVDTYNQVLQFFGAAPDEIALQYQRNEWQSRLQRDAYNERQSLLVQFYAAQSIGDIDEVRKIREKMRKFSNKDLIRKMGIGITSDTISKSVEQRTRKANEQIGGLVLPDRERKAILEELGYVDESGILKD